MDWNAWFYYRIATALLDPLDFLFSPNLEKLQQEADLIRPPDLSGKAAMTFYAQDQLITVTAIDTSTALAGLDLDVHYAPDTTQAVQLRDPISARRQVTAVMAALLKMHPELRERSTASGCMRIREQLRSSRWNCRWTRLLPYQLRRPYLRVRLRAKVTRSRRSPFMAVFVTIAAD
jgi:hypothetical protein